MSEIFYAYVDGADLDSVAVMIAQSLEHFIKNRGWSCKAPWVVNQRDAADINSNDGDLPLWDLGLNMELPSPSEISVGWFEELTLTLKHLQKICATHDRELVLGISNPLTGISEDILYLTSTDFELDELAWALGVRLPDP